MGAPEFEQADRWERGSRERVALDCLEAGIDAAHPDTVVADAVDLEGDVLRVADARFDLDAYDDIVVLGGGKAAGTVARALERVLGDRLSGAVVTDDPVDTAFVDVLPGDHPIPSADGVASTRRVLDRAADAGERTLVLAVVTGGASALLAAPVDGIDLTDLRATTDALLRSGATIHELNSVRKHLSAVKGGRLARELAPARVATLVFSDVVGDDLDVVGSGPTVPDSSTYADALAVLDDYGVDAPEAVVERLEAGARGERDETPGAESSAFDRVSAHVLANADTAVSAAAAAAADAGYTPLVLSTRVRGEAREAALSHVAVAEEAAATGRPVEPPAAVVAGGEVTVTVGDSPGVGGPNLEFALAAARELAGDDALGVLATVDTDGIDGAADAAGALVTAETVEDGRAARRALREHDVSPVLDDAGALLRCGQTGTNVNDLRVHLVGAGEE
ncbi:glycerate kinase type-2 family protein [Halocalculus aciditolerans]|uniref:Hydroxypyruvate reductase n=1 Tax=Halocalculus aciditolerans TaxID=1383812 RepID=A0A830FD49_9EURY|nr:DUF4147 domain-containing protein [Halocalculus aciditolerans]GGL63609.1 hydroxypyruvate reductase [Halocalculus aciditolerans]